MATRKDQVQISIAFLTDESKQYARLIEENKKFIADIKAAKKEGGDLTEVIKRMAASGKEISKIPLDKLAPSQLISRARQLKQVLDLIPQSAPQYKQLEGEYKAINDQLAEMRARTRGVSEAMNQARTMGGVLSQTLSAVVGVFGGLSLSNIVSQVLNYGKQLFGVGTTLDSLRQKTTTVFGDAEGIVRGFAETNARELGLARQEYINLATSAGDLLKPMGFTEGAVANLSAALTDQAGVLAEWSNGKVNTEQASEILTKALLGERDALNTLGVDIKQDLINQELKAKGLDSLTGASRRQAEALITLEQITKQSASANEAFANNSDSAARKSAQLRARLAEISQEVAGRLKPVFSALLDIGLTLVEWAVRFAQTLAAIPQFISENRVAIGLLIASLIAFNAQGIAAAANAIRMAAAQKAATIATNAQVVAQRLLNFALRTNPIGFVIGLLAGLAAIFITAYQRSETFRRVVTGVFQAVKSEVLNLLGIFVDFGKGLYNLFSGNFQEAATNFASSWNRINPLEIGKRISSSFKAGYESVPPPEPEVKADEPKAKEEGSKVGKALVSGFDAEFDRLKNSGERGANALAKAAKDALKLRLDEIEAAFLKEEIVADRALFKRETDEAQHAKNILELRRKQYQDQIEAFKRFHQEESREALDAQKKLQEIENQLTRQQIQPLAALPGRGLAPVASQTAGLAKQADVAAADDEIKILNDKLARVVDAEQNNELLRLEMQRNALNNRLDLLRANGLTETQEYQRTLDDKIKADDAYQEKLVENERRTAELKRTIQQEGLSASADLFGVFADLLAMDEAARKKNAGAIKAYQTAQVTIQGIAEVQKIWAGVAELGPIAGPVIGAIQTAVAVGRTALAISKINKTKFAAGGYTGSGWGLPDETGHRPVGTVHEHEWVAPRWMVQSPLFSATINALEAVRRRGFAGGGYATTPSPAVTGISIPGAGQDMMAAFTMMSNEIRGLRNDVNSWRTKLKAEVAYTDVEDAGTELNYIREDAAI